MAVQIVRYRLEWNVEKGVGRARLRGNDSKTWNSPLLDAAQFAAYEAVLRLGASADQGWLFSEGGSESAQLGDQALSGENPFPW
jgi:hypothetical protein